MPDTTPTVIVITMSLAEFDQRIRAATLAAIAEYESGRRPDTLLSRRDAAKRLGISISTLAREVAMCRLSPKRVGARVMFAESELTRYAAEEI